jgi:two-component system, NtrC family, sensor kinase
MKLEVVAGPDRGKVFEFDETAEVFVGRDPSVTMHLADDQCSRRHARLYSDGDRVCIEDLDSTNGLRVNGRLNRGTALCPGDEIGVGKTTFRVFGVPGSPGATLVAMRDTSDTVLFALPHAEADLLGGGDTGPTRELMGEQRILRELCEISSEVAGTHVVQTSLDHIVARVHELLQADTTCILSQGDAGEEWDVRAAWGGGGGEDGITVSRTIAGQAMRDGVAILSSDPLDDVRFAPSDSIVAHNLASAICSPIKVDDVFVGVLFLDRRRERPPFRQIDLRFAATVGNLVGVLLENERLQFEAQRQQRLATIGEVMAGVAHYAKNIIQGLRISVATLRMAAETNKLDRMPDCIESVMSQERRISALVMDMLGYSKDRQPVRVSVEIPVLLEELAAPYRGELETLGTELRIEVGPDCPLIHADEQSLHRVFLNLLTNAMDALGDVDQDREKRIAVTATPASDGDGVEIRFRDTGMGIPRAKLDKIFDVFYSTKGSGGTGLGLAVVRKIVREHGGDVTVESCEGEWTEFTVRLPCDDAGEKSEGEQ